MTQCPTCKLAMESHSTAELMECCMKQFEDIGPDDNLDGICPNCKYEITKHSNDQLVECTLAYLKSD